MMMMSHWMKNILTTMKNMMMKMTFQRFMDKLLFMLLSMKVLSK